MSKSKTGLISKDFPLYHSDLVPTYSDPDSYKYNHTHIFSNKRLLYTNEHPEIFRLEGMKEGGYFNPYISESIKIDRSEYLKKLSLDRKNVNFIDFIKSNRKYSQDPKVIRYITVDTNKELKLKRMGKNNLTNSNNLTSFEEKEKSKFKNSINISPINERNKYHNLIKKLNHYVPKIDYRIKNTLDIKDNDNKVEDNYINKNRRCNTIGNIDNDEICFNTSIPVNMKNFSNFKLSDMEINKDKKSNDYDFKFNRKSVEQYNPIKDKMESITPPPFNNKKWSSFLENYFLLENTGKKFSRKGGLFSEFCNKNKNNISINKYYLQQKLKTQKEEKEKSKEKKI